MGITAWPLVCLDPLPPLRREEKGSEQVEKPKLADLACTGRVESSPVAQANTTVLPVVEVAHEKPGSNDKSGPEHVGSLRWQLRVIILENPPVLATLAAVIVAAALPLQKLFFGTSAPLQFATIGLLIIGKATP